MVDIENLIVKLFPVVSTADNSISTEQAKVISGHCHVCGQEYFKRVDPAIELS